MTSGSGKAGRAAGRKHIIQESELHVAAMRGDLAEVVSRLDAGADVNERDWLGTTPLHAAVEGSGAPAFLPSRLALLSAQRDIPESDSRPDGSEAAAPDHLAVARLLLATGADVDARDRRETTPLSLAAARGGIAMAQLLLDHGADIEASDEDRANPLMHAAAANQYAMFRFLLEHGADVYARTAQGRTLLMLAADNGGMEVARDLLGRGADVNARSADGSTALMLAATKGHAEVKSLLLDAGAEVGFLEAVAFGDLNQACISPLPGPDARTAL